MTAKFDPVVFYEEAYARIRKETGREDCHGEALRALAAEAAKIRARRDVEICRSALWLVSAGPKTVAAAPETPEYFAQLIEKDAGL